MASVIVSVALDEPKNSRLYVERGVVKLFLHWHKIVDLWQVYFNLSGFQFSKIQSLRHHIFTVQIIVPEKRAVTGPILNIYVFSWPAEWENIF